MNIREIKQAVKQGKTVCWKSELYRVIGNDQSGYVIKCLDNGSCVGLHGKEGTEFENKLNGKEADFFTLEQRVGEMEDLFSLILHHTTDEWVKSQINKHFPHI